MIITKEEAIEEIEKARSGVPKEAIMFLYNHTPDKEIEDKLVLFLSNAFNEEFLDKEDASSNAPLFYAYVAQNHISEKLIDPVIRLFTTTDDDWDYLFEQGSILIALLAQKYPDIVIPKVLDEITEIVEKGLKLPFLYLYDVFYFIDKEKDVDKYKDKLLQIYSNDKNYWQDTLAPWFPFLGITEAIPLIKQKIDSFKKTDNVFVKLNQNEHKEALRQFELEEGSEEWKKFQKQMQPFFMIRSSLDKYLLQVEKRFAEAEEESYDDYDFDFPQPVKVEKKPGRNEPCHCGSGKKYKKCCQEKDDALKMKLGG